MPADPINLRQARKARARAEKETIAAANRAKFGGSKAQRLGAAAHDDHANRYLDGHKLYSEPTSAKPTPAKPKST